jgi:hypothetical protein
MPQYRNPYDFVPLEDSPDFLDVAPTLAHLGGLSGRIVYELTPLTPLCIHQDPGKRVTIQRAEAYQFAHLGGQPRIPATSLKGMLRNVHEALTNSTMGILNGRAWYAEHDKTYVPSAYRPGGKHLTASEALFGMVGAGKVQPDGRAGRLFIDDIVVHSPVELKLQPVSRPSGGQPKPAHESFYFHPNGHILGRKFYYHQRSFEDVLAEYRYRRMPEILVQVVPTGATLIGALRFVGLSDVELDALIYTLILEDNTAHKLGYGKPLGLGSVRIRITKLEMEPLQDGIPARFLSYGVPTAQNCTAEITQRRDRARAAWMQRAGGSASHAAFTAIARWPQSENFVYPNFDYFRSQRGRRPQEPLWEYQGRAPSAYYPGATPGATTVVGHDEPQQETTTTDAPVPPPAERRFGTFDRRPHVGMSVEDTNDGKIYQTRPTDSASRKLLRRLSDMLDNSPPPRVSFRIDIGEDLNGKRVYVAVDLQQEGAAE